MDACIQFLPGVAADHVRARLLKAAGKELESGKLASPESSAALAVNTFGWFIDRPHLLPPLPHLDGVGRPEAVDVEYCARFPWSGGRHPWLDAVIETSTHLIGVESKRYEPFRDQKSVSLSDAYDRPIWGEAMGQFELMRDLLRSGDLRFNYLDAAQLVKHAFGLATDAKRRSRNAVLYYLYAEPAHRNGTPISAAAIVTHRREVDEFATAVEGAAVRFAACSYREWLSTWSSTDPSVFAHAKAVLDEFQP